MTRAPSIFLYRYGAADLLKNYAAALTAAGLRPRIGGDLAAAGGCAGLLLCGGGDSDPALYGQENLFCRNVDLDRDLRELAEGREITRVIVDPSAASFIEALRREGFSVVRADNDVADGIRVTADLLKRRQLVICDTCADCLREMETYCWDARGQRDAPRKEQDHAMDDLRYFAMDAAAGERGGFAATWVERRA